MMIASPVHSQRVNPSNGLFKIFFAADPVQLRINDVRILTTGFAAGGRANQIEDVTFRTGGSRIEVDAAVG